MRIVITHTYRELKFGPALIWTATSGNQKLSAPTIANERANRGRFIREGEANDSACVVPPVKVRACPIGDLLVLRAGEPLRSAHGGRALQISGSPDSVRRTQSHTRREASHS